MLIPLTVVGGLGIVGLATVLRLLVSTLILSMILILTSLLSLAILKLSRLLVSGTLQIQIKFCPFYYISVTLMEAA